MFDHLDIYTRSERWAVGLADAGLSALTWPLRSRRRSGTPGRILLLRLERIGDLLMSLGAIRAVRAQAPAASIDLVVGGWNAGIARLIAEVDRVETLDAPWLARGEDAGTAGSLARRAIDWRGRRYDLAINFEGDIRSHALLALAGARRRVGFGQAGGGPLLTDVAGFDGGRHVADNGMSLVERAFDLAPGSLRRATTAAGAPLWRLEVPEAARAAARAMLGRPHDGAAATDGPLLAVHAPGGRAIKQWPVERFAESAAALAVEHGAAVLLTGAPADTAVVDEMAQRLGARGVRCLRAQGSADLVMLAALLQQCALLLTGDTGPMHLSAAVSTPVVAVFGPSMPWRYGPIIEASRIVRVDLPCSPCNRIRVPPARCQGHTPDCLAEVRVEAVVAAGRSLLVSPGARAAAGAR